MNVLDSFVIELGLDGRKFEEGQRDAMAAFEKTKQEAAKWGKGIEEQANKLSDAFGVIKRGMVGIVGAFVGAEAATFIDRMAQMDASTTRLAHSIHMVVPGMSLWQGIVQQFGGTAQGAADSLANFADSMTRLATGQAQPGNVLASLLSQAAPNWRDMTLQGKWSELLESMAEFVGRHPENPALQRMWLEAIPGVGDNQAFLFALQATIKARKEAADAARAQGLLDERAGEAAVDYSRKASQLELALQHLARDTYPALTGAIDAMFDTLGQASQVSTDLGKGNFGRALFGDFWDYIWKPGANWGGVWDIIRGRTPGGTAPSGSAGIPGGTAPSGPAGIPGGTAPSGPAGVPQGNWTNFLSGLSYLETSQTGAANSGSSARGYFQFLSGTASEAMAAGIPDPRSGTYSQQAAATMAFIKKFYPQAAAAIERGDIKTAVMLLRDVWPSLPGGKQPQKPERYQVWRQELLGGGPRPPSSPSVGAAATAASKSTVNNQKSSTIGPVTININSDRSDPKQVAAEVPAALQRWMTGMGLDTALT